MSFTKTMASATAEHRRRSSSSNPKERFPELDYSQYGDFLATHDESGEGATLSKTLSPAKSNYSIGNERRQPRKDSHLTWGTGNLNVAGPREHGHVRQSSLSDAFRNIRNRKASVSENAHEIAEALKAPISVRTIVLCLVWYLSSALTNTSSKSILNAFPKPITLTIIQFAFVSGWCLFLAYLARLFPRLKNTIPALRNGIRYPTRDVIATTMPLALFQIGGHILSSTATEKIPVSLVHTIKGLSPLFTVLAYRFIYEKRYPTAIYLSLIPLTVGVILACSVEFSGNLFGVICAFGGALIFVTQNIFSKQLFDESARAEADGAASSTTPRKLDKLNLLCYCSGLAFVLTFPIWLWTDALPLYSAPLGLTPHVTRPHSPTSSLFLPLEFFFNGIFHFAQNMLAFVLLSLVSPVTYSVASLIKRVFVIIMAIVWFGNSTTSLQGVGIALTFLGLYLYDRASNAAKADRHARSDDLRIEKPLLPMSSKDTILEESPLSMGFSNLPLPNQMGHMFGSMNGHGPGDDKKSDDAGLARPRTRSQNESGWLPPGTKQEETWRPRDSGLNPGGPKPS